MTPDASPPARPDAAAPRAGGAAYRFVRALARRLLRFAYRRVEVEGLEHVPAEGPLLVVANHQHALVDSLALLDAVPRPAGPLAKAPLFRVPVLGRLLRGVGAVPVFRPQDTAENEGRGARANVEILEACSARLRAGEALVLFPEGASHAAPRLLPLRTGAARIALDAGVPVTVLPVGLVFEDGGRRRGTVLVRFAPPIRVDGGALAPSARRAAVVATTRAMEAALRAAVAEADTHADLAAMAVLDGVLAQARGDAADATLATRHAGVRRLARALPELRRADPAALDALRAATTGYARTLAAVGLDPARADASYTPGKVLRFLATNAARLLLLGPLALVAAVATWPARALGDVVALRRGPAAEDVVVLYRILGQSVVLVGWTLLVAVACAVLVAPWAGLVALGALPLLFALHLAWRDARADAAAHVRAFLLLAGGRLRDDLRAQRDALVAQVDAARARLVAAGVAPDGTSADAATR